VASDVFDPY